MKKSRWLISTTSTFILLLVILPFASAGELFSDWVISEEPFMIEDKEFTAKYVSGTGRVVINSSEGKIILSQGDCRKRDLYQYCFLNVDTTKAKYVQGKEYAAINLLITSLEPSLQVERVFSTTTPKINDRFTIEGFVKNVGESNANNLVYEEYFPDWMRVTYATIPIVNNGVRMSASYLMPGNQRPFRYIVEVRDYKE